MLKASIAVCCAAGLLAAGAVDDIVKPLADARSPGLAVLLREGGRTIYARGYGVRDLRTRAKIDAATNFRLASFTKQFTAMSIMLLVHDGKLRYTDTLAGLFPALPAYARTVTIRHLLTHTSGLPDYEDLMGEGVWTSMHQIQDEEVLRLLERQSTARFAAGTKWEYSNSGYVLLGLIAAKVSGQPFERLLHDRIFEPLGMNRTLLFRNGQNTVTKRAYGHAKKGDAFVETDQSATSATQGDGGIYSNLIDLAKWDESWRDHKLLGEAEMRAALTPAMLDDGSDTKGATYGLGWFLDPWQGRRRMWHNGSTTGFSTSIQRFQERDLTVVVLCNRTDLDAGEIALRIAAAELNQTSKPTDRINSKALLRSTTPGINR